MEHDLTSFQPLLLVTVLALIAPFIIHRIRYFKAPVVVGEILCGIIVGHSGLNLIKADPLLEFLSELGFTYLMFLGGMEIDFSKITGGKKSSAKKMSKLHTPLNLAYVTFIGTLTLCLCSAFYFKKTGLIGEATNPLMLALMIGTTSVGVVLPTLKETGLVKSDYGQTILSASIIADFATIVLATLAMVLLNPSSKTIEILGLVALSVIFYLVFRAGASFASRPIVKRIYEELSHTSAQLRIRTAFALMLLFTVLSRVVGVEMILGAFVAGTIFNTLFRSESAVSEAKFDAIGYGFLIPIFFIMVGVRLDLSILWGAQNILRNIVFLVGAAFIVKLLPALILAPRFGFRNAVAGGFLLNGRMSLVIAFAEVAVAAKLLEPALQPVAVVIALITCTVSPVAFMKLYRKETSFPSQIGIVILGAGKIGRTLAKRLHDRRHMVRLLDKDLDAVEKAKALGLSAFHSEHIDAEALKKAGISNSNVFVAATNDDMANLSACVYVRDTFGVPELVSRVGNPDNAYLFAAERIRSMNTTMASVVALENIVYRPNVFGALSHEESATEIIEVKVRNPLVASQRIQDIQMPGNALVLLVERNGISSIPHGRARLELDDTVTVFLDSENVVEVGRIFDPDRPNYHEQPPDTREEL